MTNQQAIPFAPAPPSGYWTLHLDTQALRAKYRARGEERAIDEFLLKVDKATDLIAEKNPDPRARAEGYRNRPPNIWAEQYMTMTEDAVEDWADWEKIAPQDVNTREAVIEQVEVLLNEAGVDLRDETLQQPAKKIERLLSEPAPMLALPAAGETSGAEPQEAYS